MKRNAIPRPVVMVMNLPAKTGGALTILQEHVARALHDHARDWVFVVGNSRVRGGSNVRVSAYPGVGNSFSKRIVFELFYVPWLVRKHKPELILNLDNLLSIAWNVPQHVYLHQALAIDPSVSLPPIGLKRMRFKLLRWLIHRSVRRAEKVIVQTEFMRAWCIASVGVPNDRIAVQKPVIIAPQQALTGPLGPGRLFFYPAGPGDYKNHRILVDAVRIIKAREVQDFSVIFTLSGSETEAIRRLKETVEAEELPVEFRGTLAKSEVWSLYRKSTLVFPSKHESFGLPLYEASACGARIIAADRPHSREALRGYAKCHLVPSDDVDGLADAMHACF